MKIICNIKEYNELLEVITAGCCWIGSGEGKILKNGKKNHKADIEKFKMATNILSSFATNEKLIQWDIKKISKKELF